MNKKMLVLPLVVLALGCQDRYEGQAGAASSPSPGALPYTTESPSAYASPGTMGATIAVEVISVDTAGSSINVREPGATGAAGSQGQRLTVSSTAADMLADLRAGDRITITCDTTGTGTTDPVTGAGVTTSLSACTSVTMITRTGGATGQ